MRQKIKINFSDFWSGFDKSDNYFYNLLSKYYDVELSEKPDYLFYSVFGNEYVKFSCIRIFFTGENVRPDFLECDYAFTFDHSNDPRNYRLPLYALTSDVRKLIEPKPDLDSLIRTKTKFCNFIYNNGKAKERIEFFQTLSKRYKKVDSAGTLLNNIGGVAVGNKKREYIKDYKFTIAFENTSYPGYTTEKLTDPMLQRSIPIYWGNPLVHLDFNTKSFINCNEYKNFDEVMDRIIEIDQNDELFKEYLRQPYFVNNTINEYVKEENVLERFKLIFSEKDKITPVATTWKKYISYYKVIGRKAQKIKYKYFS